MRTALMLRACAAMAVALACCAAHGQAASAPLDSTGYNALLICARAVAARYAPTPALPQDVADASLVACSRELTSVSLIEETALARAGGSVAQQAALEQEAQGHRESFVRHVVIAAMLEARYPRK